MPQADVVCELLKKATTVIKVIRFKEITGNPANHFQLCLFLNWVLNGNFSKFIPFDLDFELV